MKNNIKKYCVIALFASMASAAYAAPFDVTIVNGDFQADGTTKITNGFANITGWSNTGTTYADSGIESALTGIAAYAKSNDDGAYQILNHTMTTGDQYTLTWDSADGWNDSAGKVSLLSAGSMVDAFSAAVSLATYEGTHGLNLTLIFTATAADNGKYIGIMFKNSGPDESWARFDEFTLEVTAVPEPGTYALLAGLTGLVFVMVRRRK